MDDFDIDHSDDEASIARPPHARDSRLNLESSGAGAHGVAYLQVGVDSIFKHALKFIRWEKGNNDGEYRAEKCVVEAALLPALAPTPAYISHLGRFGAPNFTSVIETDFTTDALSTFADAFKATPLFDRSYDSYQDWLASLARARKALVSKDANALLFDETHVTVPSPFDAPGRNGAGPTELGVFHRLSLASLSLGPSQPLPGLPLSAINLMLGTRTSRAARDDEDSVIRVHAEFILAKQKQSLALSEDASDALRASRLPDLLSSAILPTDFSTRFLSTASYTADFSDACSYIAGSLEVKRSIESARVLNAAHHHGALGRFLHHVGSNADATRHLSQLAAHLLPTAVTLPSLQLGILGPRLEPLADLIDGAIADGKSGDQICALIAQHEIALLGTQVAGGGATSDSSTNMIDSSPSAGAIRIDELRRALHTSEAIAALDTLNQASLKDHKKIEALFLSKCPALMRAMVGQENWLFTRVPELGPISFLAQVAGHLHFCGSWAFSGAACKTCPSCVSY